MRLDEQVDVMTGSDSTDNYGETTTTYSVDRTVWADVDYSRPREQERNGRTEEQTDAVVTMRTEEVSDLSITRGTRLQHSGDDLFVQGKRSNRRDGFTELSVTRSRT